MKAIFIEMFEFTEWVSQYLPDDALAELQNELMKNPEKGSVIKGCGGIRKVRVKDPKRSKGKRSGARVIYLYLPEVKQFHMIDIFDKDEKLDLSPSEKKELSRLVESLKQESRK